MDQLTPFHHFINLVVFDQALYALSVKKKNAQARLDALEADRESLAADFNLKQKALHDLRKDAHALDLELEGVSAERKSAQVKLDKASNAKEYVALQHEIEAYTTTIASIEDRLLPLWQEIEAAEGEWRETEKAYSDGRQKLDDEAKKARDEMRELDAEIDRLMDERLSKVEKVEADTLRTYESMRQSLPNPVVPIRDGTCSGCFNYVSSRDLSAARRHILVACQYCHRLLYIE